MVRPLRIEYADAWYHIMNRDRRSESIFDEEDISKVFKKKKWPAILGSRDFINRIKERFFTEKADDEIPQSRELAPEPDQIKKAVCRHYRIVDEDELLVSKRGIFNEPRNVAIYLNRRLRGDSLKQVAEQFQVKKYSSVSSVIERMKAAIKNDRRLRGRIEYLVSALRKGSRADLTPYKTP
jgi:putative transposase